MQVDRERLAGVWKQVLALSSQDTGSGATDTRTPMYVNLKGFSRPVRTADDGVP